MRVAVRSPHGDYTRVVFDGAEEDAKQYLIDNFPRLHSDGYNEPSPDAMLVDGRNEVGYWDGKEWSQDKAVDPADDPDFDDETAIPNPSPDLFPNH